MEQRYDAVMEVLKEGRTVVEVAARYGVSRQSVHNWITRYQEEGIEALANRSSRPRGCPHQMPPELETRVVQMRLAHPRWGPKTIAFQLERAGVDQVPSPSGIKRALRRRGLVEYGPRRRKKKQYRRWERDWAMELWQMDVVGEILLKDGTELKAVTGVDDHSRYCVSAKLVRRATSRAVCDALLQALERHGVPDELLTDNAKVFTGRIGPHPVECSSTASAGRTAYATCSRPCALRPRRARSSASTGRFETTFWQKPLSPTSTRPRRRSTCGWRSTTPGALISPSTWRLLPSASQRPSRVPSSSSQNELNHP
jgi:transposase